MPQPKPSDFRHLVARSISQDSPGSILTDFQTLLDFVDGGVPSTGKYCLLPMARLAGLDERMSRPLRPRLERPQQRSFPHLNGLYLLLRATRLGIPEDYGKTGARLILDPAMHTQWLQLNDTERYFNLLEAWLRWASWDAAGAGAGRLTSFLALNARELWMCIPPQGYRLSETEKRRPGFLYSPERASTLALMELFGLMVVEREEPDPGQNWRVASVRRTPFGNELLTIVFEEIQRDLLGRERRTVHFGAWQPVLRPYFPQWVNNLRFEDPKPGEGTYYFKVSLASRWRRIAIPASCTVDELADCIIDAYDFDGDHLYAFLCVARDGRRIEVAHPYVHDVEAHTTEMTIGQLPLQEGQSMEFVYDFGASWRFKVKLERIASEETERSAAMVVESRGKSPPEYEDDW